jgi:hypothetical protein
MDKSFFSSILRREKKFEKNQNKKSQLITSWLFLNRNTYPRRLINH